MRAVLYVNLPGAGPAAVAAAELRLRSHATNADLEVVGSYADTATSPERPGLRDALDAKRAHGAGVLVATDASGFLWSVDSAAAMKDIIRTYAPYGL